MAVSTFREPEDQNLWNVVFSIFFIIVLSAALYLIWRIRGEFPTAVSFLDAILMMLATLRLTRLIVYDKITRWFRELFVEKLLVERDGHRMVELRPFNSGILHTAHDLLQCPWCIGIWSGLIVVFLYFIFPLGWTVILFLALSGAGSFLQVTANIIGWNVEQRKYEVQKRDPQQKL